MVIRSCLSAQEPLITDIVSWQTQQGPVSKQGFFDLFANQVGYIAVDNFLTPTECQALSDTLIRMGLHQYNYNFDIDSAPPAAHLFETHYLYEEKTPAEYFPAAANSIAEYKKLCATAKVDPAAKMAAFLAQHLQQEVKIATQDEQPYSYVIARELRNSALMHADFAGFIPQYWSISKVIAQYAWNIYLSNPGNGGECIVHDKLWEKADDAYIVGNTYGYDHVLVANKEHATISAQSGRLVFFNSRNFHEVNASSQPRLSVGGHVGLTENQEVILWV